MEAGFPAIQIDATNTVRIRIHARRQFIFAHGATIT